MTNIDKEYLRWLCKLVNGNNYTELLATLHSVEFYWSNQFDDNRVCDGLELRKRFVGERKLAGRIDDIFPYKCTVLEMMIGLSVRCEEEIMHVEDLGNRTEVWFWNMIDTMHLSKMTNEYFNKRYSLECIYRMLDRKYLMNGDGGLFKVSHHNCDMREVDIWYQMNYFLVESYPV